MPDYVGAFAVTAGVGEDEIADRFKLKNDDYSAILVKALADSFARESLHLRRPGSPDVGGIWSPGIGETPLEVAYVTRWIELDGGTELHGWRTLCQRAR